MDMYLLECLPDTLAEAYDIIAAIPEADRKEDPQIQKIVDLAASLIELCR